MQRLHRSYLVRTLEALGALVILVSAGCGTASRGATQEDSLKILYVQYYDENKSRQLYTLDASNSRVQQITERRQLFALDIQASVSPDGTMVAFVSNRDDNREIYVIASDGSNQQRLTNDDANEAYPGWSPDGSRIAFLRSDVDWDYGEIWTMAADGSDQRAVVQETPESFLGSSFICESPFWQIGLSWNGQGKA